MPEGRTPLGDHAYRLLVEAVVDYAIYLLDPDGRVASWNRGAQRIKGYAAAEVLGRHFSLFFTEEDRAAGLPGAALETARRDGRFESEGWRARKDGSRFWALAVLEAVRDEDGRHVGFAKVTRDMTERREAQQALAESERRFRLLVQGVSDYAIFMLDPAGMVANWNSGARRIKGWAADEIVGEHFSRFYTAEDRAAGVPDRALADAAGTGRFEAEGWRVRKDGSLFWASVVIDAIRDEGGTLVGFAKVTRDITERREAQRAMEEARARLTQAQKLEALGQLTGGVAHDFNNILQAFTGGVALAERMAGGHEGLSRVLAEMRTAAARGTSLTRHLLAFSRRAPDRPEVVETGAAVRRAADLFARALRGDIRVCLDIPDGLWPVRVDPAQFELALLNVAVNARDAMPGGGSLAVAARNLVPDRGAEGLRGRLVEVLLRDTGEGIPREVLERVVEPFFTTKPPGKGTGLGLSQAHGFARQAGGALRIESEPGRGTEVAFLLPAAPEGVEAAHPTAPEAAARAPGSGALAAAGGGGARVLVVDDDPAVARMAVGMLESMGWRAAAVGGAEDALRLLGRGERFDAVLSDVLMPGGMGGVALAREIGRRWPGLPVLLATGYAGAEGAGPHGYPVLHKPYATPELAVALGALLAARRAPRGRGSRGGWAAEPEGEDERQAAGATAPGGARSGPEGPEGVAPPPADHDDPGTPRGAETRVRAAEAGGGEAQAAKDTSEPDSLGG